MFLGSSDNGKIYLADISNYKGIFKDKKSRNVSFNENELFIEVKRNEGGDSQQASVRKW